MLFCLTTFKLAVEDKKKIKDGSDETHKMNLNR